MGRVEGKSRGCVNEWGGGVDQRVEEKIVTGKDKEGRGGGRDRVEEESEGGVNEWRGEVEQKKGRIKRDERKRGV